MNKGAIELVAIIYASVAMVFVPSFTYILIRLTGDAAGSFIGSVLCTFFMGAAYSIQGLLNMIPENLDEFHQSEDNYLYIKGACEYAVALMKR